MWVEFVVGSRPCSKGLWLGSPVFFPPKKTPEQWMKSHSVDMPLHILISYHLFIYLLFYLFIYLFYYLLL